MQTATNAGMCVGVSWATDQRRIALLMMYSYYKQSIGFNNSFITVQWQRYKALIIELVTEIKQSLIYIIYR
jgi:hypothetical protein